MSTAQECLGDAVAALHGARDALADGLIGMAILHLCHANRFHALALGINSASSTAQLGDAEEVGALLVAVRAEVIAAAAPARPTGPQVVAVVREGLKPLLRELATPQANPEDVIAARAANTAAILSGEFDLRVRTV